jgi:hypothetical protein
MKGSTIGLVLLVIGAFMLLYTVMVIMFRGDIENALHCTYGAELDTEGCMYLTFVQLSAGLWVPGILILASGSYVYRISRKKEIMK